MLVVRATALHRASESAAAHSQAKQERSTLPRPLTWLLRIPYSVIPLVEGLLTVAWVQGLKAARNATFDYCLDDSYSGLSMGSRVGILRGKT